MTTALARRGTAPGRHRYDTIVVGGQLAGAMTTAMLAKRGLHVLHVPHDGQASPYAHKEYLLPHVAFVLPAPKTVAAFDEVLAEVGLHSTPAHRLVRQPGLQLVRPGNWFELKRDEKERAAELKRALRTTAGAFELELARAVAAATPSDAFFASRPDLLPEGLYARWRFKRLLGQVDGLDPGSPLPKGSPLWALMPWAAGVQEPAALTEARTFGQLLGGVSVVPGGREGLTTLFLERARELGADVLGPEALVEQFVFEGSTLTGVRLARADTVYRGALVVGACDLDVLAKLMPDGRAGAARFTPRASKGLFTLNVVLPESALPRGLGELALVESEGESGALLLQVEPTRGPGLNPETTELRTLTVSCVAPLALRSGSQPAARAFIDGLWARLAALMPFTRAHAKLESTPWLDSAAVQDRGVEPLPLFERAPGAWLGVTGLSTSSPWKHLLLANRQVLPGLGLEGEVLAATRAVDRIDRALKRNDPLKKRSA
jgi:phytoene dehydrogenase-like protein